MAHPRVSESLHWFKPSAALGRFNPAHGGAAVSRKAAPRQRARYGFRVGDLGFLIGPDTMSEVVAQSTVYLIPQTPTWLAGLINLRGNLVPVFDMTLCLELVAPPPEKRYLLVLDTGDKAIGLFVESMPQPADTSHILSQLPPLPEVLRPYVTTVYRDGDTLWLEFDHRVFFESLAGPGNR